MTTAEVAALPVGALLYNAKTWVHLLLVRNTETELVWLQIGHAYAYLPPTLRQRALEFPTGRLTGSPDFVAGTAYETGGLNDQLKITTILFVYFQELSHLDGTWKHAF